ncbi:MAG: hypothetical protein GY710_04485 [Desulfobacteraceae bacterium]|nr:hypothetical protein [Desulfobacteraceae bacterium]
MVDKKLSIILLTLFFLLTGCAPKGSMPVSLPVHKIHDKALIAKLNQSILHQYPNRFKAVHHVALTLFEKTYVLNGYFTLDRSKKQIQLIAQNDMGGTLFEIHTQKENTNIQSKIDFLKARWLKKSVVKDLENLYLNTALKSPVLSRGPDNLFLLSENQEGICREYLFKKESSPQDSYRLMGYKLIKNNKKIYAINYIYDKKNDGQYPSFITLEDKNLHYQLKINIQYFFTPTKNGKNKG